MTKKRGFQGGNTHGAAGRGGKRSRGDASAPVPTPRSPRARRFRRHRSLSSPPLHRGALETAPAAGIAAPDVAMATDASHATVRRPAPPAPPAGKPPPQLPPSRCCAPMRTCTPARTHNLPPTALSTGQAAATASAAQIEHSTSAAQQPTAQVWPLSAGRCARPAHAPTHARPAFDPAAAAVRRCCDG